jgi:two-component system sensor histidine kinase TctE
MNPRRTPTRKPARSIARLLLIELVAIAALLSALLYVAVKASSHQAAESTHDGLLAASAEAIAERLAADEGELVVDIPYGALAMLGAVSDDSVFYRVIADGETLTGYHELLAPSERPNPAETVFYSAELEGQSVRVAALSRRVALAGRTVPAEVLVAQTREGQQAIVSSAAERAALIGIGSFALAGVLCAIAVRRAIAPLRRVAHSVERRGPADLRPLREPLPRELEPLGNALDGFMARLDSALERTETLIAETAHHVRTPLAVLRTRAETALRRTEDVEMRSTLRDLVRAVDASARSADQLLEHAMVGHRSERMTLELLDMGRLTNEVVERYRPVAELRDVVFDCEIEAGVEVTGDRVQLETALRNLIDNAVKYSPAETHIDVSAARRLDEVVVYIRDRGRGLDGAEQQALTERYKRGSNVEDVVGSGLGLAIVEQVATAHAGRVSVTPAEDSGTQVELCLPAA